MVSGNTVPRAWRHRLAATVLLLPLVGWFWAGASGGLGVNPAETLMRDSGVWTLRLLALGLAVTPLRTWTGWSALAPWRRTVGLYAFFYACLHLLAWAWLDQGFELPAMARDVVKRPFVWIGALTWLLMVPLVITSFRPAVRRIGGLAWRRLHQTVYAIAVLGLVHFFWLRAAKHRFETPTLYAVVIGLLLLWRVAHRWKQSRHGD